jgi:hypothetical protein
LIDFRYHLVSIIAVFLALAIGIILGSEAIKPTVQSTLYTEVKTAQQNNHKLYQQNGQLTQRLAFDNSFAQAASGTLLTDRLTGQSVVLVLAPGADSSTVNGISSALRRAGAKVTGQVLLATQFFDTSTTSESALRSTAINAAPPGIALPKSSNDSQISGQQAAAQVIATAIVAKDGAQTMPASQTQSILSQFGQQNFLQVSGAHGARLAGQATMAVVVIPGTVPPLKVSDTLNLALISLTKDLQEVGDGALLAGNYAGSGPGSAIDAVTSGGAGVALTTVDDAGSETGQIVVVQALRQMLDPHATPTSYGAGPAAAPSPAPSPSVSPSPSPSTTPPKKKKRA